MGNNTGYVIQGDDGDNKLTAVGKNVDGHLQFYNIVNGAGGDDVIKVDDWLAGHQFGADLYGDDGNDIIWDSNQQYGNNNDTLSGGAGDDVIHSSGGKDIIDGGDGIDTLSAYVITLKPSSITGIEIFTRHGQK